MRSGRDCAYLFYDPCGVARNGYRLCAQGREIYFDMSYHTLLYSGDPHKMALFEAAAISIMWAVESGLWIVTLQKPFCQKPMMTYAYLHQARKDAPTAGRNLTLTATSWTETALTAAIKA